MQEPELSIVIAGANPQSLLAATLTALDCQTRRGDMEVIVVSRLSEGPAPAWRERFPWLRTLHRPGRESIPQLRYIGIREARGRIVAVIEDHVAPEPDWAEAMLALHSEPWSAVGGAVENGEFRLTDWAAFLAEYSAHMLPVPDGPYAGIPGSNASYKREILTRYDAELAAGSWESFFHNRIIADGGTVRSSPRAVIHHKRPFPFCYFMRQRWHYGRSFAGMRCAGRPLPVRAAYAIGSAILPFVLLLRIAGTVFRKRRHIAMFLLSLPVLWAFLCAGAAGEAAGSAFGAGNSLAEVE